MMREFLDITVILPLAAAIALSLVAQLVVITSIRSRRTFYQKIAFVGPPRSGKTTLITAMFDRVLQSNDHPQLNFEAVESIDQYTDNIRSLQSGDSVAQTDTDEMFIYRFSYASSQFSKVLTQVLQRIVPVKLKEKTLIELGDFAGDYTNELADLSKQAPSKLHLKIRPNIGASAADDDLRRFIQNSFSRSVASKFIDWIRNADTVIFIIDWSYLCENEKERGRNLLTDYRAIWLHLLRSHYDRNSSMGVVRPVIILTKSDLAISKQELETLDSCRIDRSDLQGLTLNPQVLDELVDEVFSFQNFLKKNSRFKRGVDLVLTSALHPADSGRIGIDESIGSCLRF